MCCFNTQPPEGGWVIYWGYHATTEVSTHSRPKAAVFLMRDFFKNLWFQHTAARRRLLYRLFPEIKPILFQHTAARRRLPLRTSAAQGCWGFQHTAARRRLTVLACLFPTCTVSTHSRPKAADRLGKQRKLVHKVSTHSRPKAAGLEKDEWLITQKGFNTQPPEGG